MPERKTYVPSRFVYTEEMRSRALERTKTRRLTIPESALWADYMATMFRAFRRRLCRELPSSLAMKVSQLPDVPDSGLVHKPPAKKRRRRGVPPDVT